MTCSLFSLKYREDGRITPDSELGMWLVHLYRSLFKLLGSADERRPSLKIGNISEDEFKNFDPLRAT